MLFYKSKVEISVCMLKWYMLCNIIHGYNIVVM